MKSFVLAGVLMLGLAGAVAIAADMPVAGGGGAKALTGGAKAAKNKAAKPDVAAALQKREAKVDKREENQERRIEQGVKKGQLTDSEVDKLKALESAIDSMEGQFKSDGKLSKDEVQQLRKALNDASLQIWAERHDTEGNQKPVSRLGKDIFAKDDLTSLIESGKMTESVAKAFLADLHQMVKLKRELATENLSSDERAKLQAEYNDLLNKYFLIRNGAAAKTAKAL